MLGTDLELEAAQRGAEPGITVKRCMFGDNLVFLASDAPPEERANPLCINHAFAEDPTEAWEFEK